MIHTHTHTHTHKHSHTHTQTKGGKVEQAIMKRKKLFKMKQAARAAHHAKLLQQKVSERKRERGRR